jgi:prophage DNA circulation protein
MVRLHCARCGHGWDYTGSSDHYCTCPNCKTSVKVQESREKPEQRGGGEVAEEARERVEAMEKRLVEVDEVTDSLTDEMAETVPEMQGDIGHLEERVEAVETGVGELAEIVEELVEELGGRVEYESGFFDEVEVDGAGTELQEALDQVGEVS